MVEITTVSLIDRAKAYLGLRGKAIVSSRNSIYPVIILNSDTQQVPIRPPCIPSRSDVTLTKKYRTIPSGTTTEYTVPVGRVAYVCLSSINCSATNTVTSLYVADASNNPLLFLNSAITTQSAIKDYAVPVKVLEGEKLVINATGAGTGSEVTYFLWEESSI